MNLTYPSLYRVADAASLTAQKRQLRLTIAHASLLLIGSVMAINNLPTKEYSLTVAFVFFLALGLSIFLGIKKYEKNWYNGRAVAESIKTATWRYSMRAVPFGDAASVHSRRSEFRNMLNNILRTNNELGEYIGEHQDTNEQITTEMNSIRALSLDERKAVYLKNRIDEQRQWYAQKASNNKKMQRRWFCAISATQLAAISCVLLRIAYPDWLYWPTDTFVLLASFCISWVQLKKFNELSSAYSLTAQEIGIIRGQSENISTEEQLSEFVNNAELAFSREHTQWVARQDT
ncbi:DUF4231 domain-containing protein [Vibrio algivorus]|uniref:DUF4231 domain-containing protein n=1 Tax=Vibrio algivorus TaxID=1667024 RepID=A0A557PFP2_9VIBR|nr:DUF4231 domain-containing protein [Vibrio algivorus]TVO39444.1 DUF4231 domain-containing protein [Vibrio algivorus]